MSESELVRRIRASYAAFSRGELDAPQLGRVNRRPERWAEKR